ncbi:MAG: adenosylcobinamide-GDP ribazoletransferase [Dehalococcoidales bacterium]
MSLLAALKFLTIIPLPYRQGGRPDEIGRSVVYFPVVGLLIGVVLAGLNWLLNLFLPAGMVNALLITALVVISGALHLDGFVDTCDGIAGHKPAEKRWEVMRDSRVGAFGVVGVVLLLLVKFAALNSVPPALLPAALIIMPVLSRWAMVYALFAYSYAREQGLGKEIKQAVTWPRFSLATVLTLAIVIGAGWWGGISYYLLAGLALMLAVWVIIILMAAYFRKMFAGLTGDTYGAINETAEVWVLILITALAYNQWLV